MTDAAPVSPTPAPAPAPDAGKTLGIVGLVLAFIAAPLGLILSIVAKVQSKNAGVKNTPATVGIVLSIIFIIGYIIFFLTVGVALFSACNGLAPGVYENNGVTLTCG